MKTMTFLLSVLLMGAVSCSGSDYNSETTDNENSTTDERIDLNGKKILIAYWSWSGNTEAVAQEIQRQAGGDLYPMQPLVPYGTTYQEVAKTRPTTTCDRHSPTHSPPWDNTTSFSSARRCGGIWRHDWSIRSAISMPMS